MLLLPSLKQAGFQINNLKILSVVLPLKKLYKSKLQFQFFSSAYFYWFLINIALQMKQFCRMLLLPSLKQAGFQINNMKILSVVLPLKKIVQIKTLLYKLVFNFNSFTLTVLLMFVFIAQYLDKYFFYKTTLCAIEIYRFVHLFVLIPLQICCVF